MESQELFAEAMDGDISHVGRMQTNSLDLAVDRLGPMECAAVNRDAKNKHKNQIKRRYHPSMSLLVQTA